MSLRIIAPKYFVELRKTSEPDSVFICGKKTVKFCLLYQIKVVERNKAPLVIFVLLFALVILSVNIMNASNSCFKVSQHLNKEKK